LCKSSYYYFVTLVCKYCNYWCFRHSFNYLSLILYRRWVRSWVITHFLHYILAVRPVLSKYFVSYLIPRLRTCTAISFNFCLCSITLTYFLNYDPLLSTWGTEIISHSLGMGPMDKNAWKQKEEDTWRHWQTPVSIWA